VAAELITAIASCVVAAVTGIGVYIAARGLRSWRAQLEGSAHFDLARRLLLEVYRLRDAVEAVRSPIMYKAEASDADSKLPWEVAAYERRWQLVLDARAPLQVCVYEARILWGDEAQELWDKLMEPTQELYRTLGTFAGLKQDPNGGELSQEQRKVLYGGTGDDAFRIGLQKAVDEVEAYVRPHLPRKESSARERAARRP
jgi:hypothetical protein